MNLLQIQADMSAIEYRVQEIMGYGVEAVAQRVKMRGLGHPTDVETLVQASCQAEMVTLRGRWKRLRVARWKLEREGRLTVRAVERWLREVREDGTN